MWPRTVESDTMLVPLSIEDCMTREVETVAPDVTARAVARTLAQANVGSLVVCEGTRPVGIVTESDLVRLLAREAALDDVTVSSFMSDDLVTIGPEAPIERAAELFEEHDIRRLPVIDDELVGIVTTTDLSDYLPRFTERRRHADAYDPLDQLPSESPEMAYDQPDWEFESHGTDDEITVGDVVRFRKELSEADVERFAEASGDTNRLHLDEEFAGQSRFGGRIVHGVLTTGLISAALARLPGLTIYLSQDLRFLGPVSIDETATAVCRVCEDLGGNKFRLDTTVYDADGERVVDGQSVVLVDDVPENVATTAESLV